MTEIAAAEEMGCEIVKLFPGSVYQSGFIKAIKGPQPWANVMPTGGVSPAPENIKAWFAPGVYCVGMGSKLMLKLENGHYDYEGIERLTKETLSLIRQIHHRQ